MNRIDISHKGHLKEKPVFCPHCSAENPPKAYCCLKCFQILKHNPPEKPVWKKPLNPIVAITFLVVFLFSSGGYLIHKWLEAVEAEMVLNLSTANYNMSIQANKRISEKEGLPVEEEENPSQTSLSTTKAPLPLK